MALELDCSDIIEIFKNHLKIENSVKSISHTFFNERYARRIDYAPYFQRNYVWDAEKATYFIESILLGTEIPPIVLFDDGVKNEVIDGRQRYETIKRFLDNDLVLDKKGLKVLSNLNGLHYAELPENIRSTFENTKIRVLQYSIVNEPALSSEQEDKVKKEIFKRYNSGIIALKPQEIERAVYIEHKMVRTLKEKLETEAEFLKKCQKVFMPRTKQNMRERDKINYILSRARTVLSMKYIPIQSYASASSKRDVIHSFYILKVLKKSVEENILEFARIVDFIYDIRTIFEKKSCISLIDNNLFYETLYWGISILIDNDIEIIEKLCVAKIADDFMNASNINVFWEHVSHEKKDINEVFFSTGSHYYMSILDRYNFVASYFSDLQGVDYSNKIKNKIGFDEIMGEELKESQFKEFRLSKTDPVSATVYDILNDVKNSQFIIRPDYQRSEVANARQKASYLLESILLGLRIPPIFIYRRKDGVSEVIDGQQRLLSILGFLREPYKDVNGEMQLSDKNGFTLSKLRFLKELNGKNIDGIENENKKYKDRILDFQIDIVEINEEQNPKFNPVDLFLRLNSKPFPIETNTFEMWNAYVTKEYVEDIKGIAKEYSKKLFKPNDTRMKNEELITMLAYLAYRKRVEKILPQNCLNIYVRNQRINARFNDKTQVTNILGEISRTDDYVFGEAIHDVKSFITKLQMLSGEEFERFSDLIAHSKKNTQSRTNQNFYLLWIALENISLDRIMLEQEKIFSQIRSLFLECQDIQDEFKVVDFLNKLSGI